MYSKLLKTHKKQFGQFLTPRSLSKKLINNINFNIDSKVLEPSFGDGSFIDNILEKFLPLYHHSLSIEQKLDFIFARNIFGVESDRKLFSKCLNNIRHKYGYLPKKHNLCNDNFFLYNPNFKFDFIVGNPPFGGSIDKGIQDKLDKRFGYRYGMKIKKETYSFL